MTPEEMWKDGIAGKAWVIGSVCYLVFVAGLAVGLWSI